MSNKETRVLLAEDDQNLSMILKDYLEAKGYVTSLYKNGQKAFQGYLQHSFDLCIIDIMMPVKDGFTLAREIRKQDTSIPIIFLTAKSMHDDIIKGFESGADDYLTKPFNMDELLARIKAIMKRSTKPKNMSGIYHIGRFTFDSTRHTLTAGKNVQKLTSKENELLVLLAEHKNQILDREKALREIWRDANYFNARSMDVYITKIRKYLKHDPQIELINIHGSGFKLLENTPSK
ncbi:MAG: response regulator transcription factor [Bacteroidales bacterium]